MGIDIGRWGANVREHEVTAAAVARIERAGYGTVWLNASPPADLGLVERMLDATTRIVAGTRVVNMWTADARIVAASYHRIVARHPDRLLLGVGVGHREVDAEYASPYRKLESYLDELAEAGVPADRIVVAAIGPRMLRLAGERTAGAAPAMVPAGHSRQARAILEPDALLLPGHFVTLETDAGKARAMARVQPPGAALGIVNYARNLRRQGFTDEDLAGGGSDRLIDALVAHGGPAAVTAELLAYFEAGADQVAISPLGGDPIDTLCDVAEWLAAARALS
ncbi:TIGR03620 family F420-dependent LLM class oxidoreductase [Nocardia higoensis]|uniref:TIGR03620 family F420-dependent LLM class oxidoreductase n=1 Tax=Nocardia higoensis TaxID=228599 RepID=UPI000304D2C6|nr:TIGR03620 family F420-dependent LLM class oxidoreductase [Nocardia higoensis]